MSLLLSYWSISSQEICSEAEKLGLEVDIVSQEKNLFYVNSKDKSVLFKSTDFGGNSALGYKICLDKGLTYDVLERYNLPIAKSFYVSKKDFSKLNEEQIKNLRYPFVIKPLDDGHGNGVMMNIMSYTELHEKLNASFGEYKNMIIQEQIEGDEIRVLVVKGEVLIAINRIPAAVKGNGINTLEELIEIENKNPLRGKGYDEPLAYIERDSEMDSYLSKLGKDINYIPKKDELVQLRGNSNLGTGGTLRDVTHILTEKTKSICCEAAKALGLEISGVDIIMKDFTKDIDTIGGIILEVGATPGIGGHKQLTEINSAKEILKRVFDL